MKLFYAPKACSLASHIALEEAGAAYEAIRVDFASGEQRKPDTSPSIPRAGFPPSSRIGAF